MKKMMIALTALVLISAAASAQIKADARGMVAQPRAAHAAPAVIPGACSPCLWYAGDTDLANPLWNAFFNANATWESTESSVWVPFIAASDGKPFHKHVSISAVTFNEISLTPNTLEPADFDGMTYGFRTGVSSGNGGTLGGHGTCPAVLVVYTGLSGSGFNEYAFTCMLTHPIKLAVGTIYWVNVTPTFTVSNVAFLDNAIDVPGLNQFGWGDDFWNSFINSTSFGANFEPAQDLFDGYGEFSVAIAGAYVD
jgi:hypothetical protein